MLEEQLLDAKFHDRKSFSCGISVLDQYIQQYASQQVKNNLAAVRILVDTDNPTKIIGYYSLSAAQISVNQLSPALAQKLPKYPLPCFRMGRLAVDSIYRKKGFGDHLMGLAVNRCMDAKQNVAAYALIVDAKDDAAKGYYKHYGFTSCIDDEMTLYLPLGK